VKCPITPVKRNNPAPTVRRNRTLTASARRVARTGAMLLPIPQPRAVDNRRLKINRPMTGRLMDDPVSTASATAMAPAKTMMTTASMITVTPRAVRVNGPLARNSRTMAMADEGERATRMEPARPATAQRPGSPRSLMGGIFWKSHAAAMVPPMNVLMTRPPVVRATV